MSKQIYAKKNVNFTFYRHCFKWICTQTQAQVYAANIRLQLITISITNYQSLKDYCIFTRNMIAFINCL